MFFIVAEQVQVQRRVLWASLFLLVLLTIAILPVAAADPPNASFSGTPTTGTLPFTVSFSDLSSNSPTGWAWFFGDENWALPAWTQTKANIVDANNWSARYWHSSVAMPDGSIVLMGGYTSGPTLYNDTWRSTNNGTTWKLMNTSAGWEARLAHSSVAMPDGSIILMGGSNDPSGSGTEFNDTWRSTDSGTTWTNVTVSAGWTARDSHSSVAMPDGSIVLMGGFDGGYKNDTWQSTNNGETWTQVNGSGGWTARYGHTSVAMPDGSIVLMGGYATDGIKNDTWRSTDNGATWTQMTASAVWAARHYHSSVAMPDGSIVLMGGNAYETVDLYKNDTWRSTDNGATWTQVNESAGWTARNCHSSVAMPDGSIVLMGGYDDSGNNKNDVWRFVPTGSSAQNPLHTYTTAGVFQVALQAFNTGGYNSTRKAGYITVTGLPAPVASFTANVTSGTAPLPVSFTDSSTNTPTGWAWFFGDENFTVPWTQMKPNDGAGWSARNGHSSVSMPDGSIVLMGGYDESTQKNDVWRSTDNGSTWTQQTAGAGWSVRGYHSSVSMPDGSIVLMGGYDESTYYNLNSAELGAS